MLKLKTSQFLPQIKQVKPWSPRHTGLIISTEPGLSSERMNFHRPMDRSKKSDSRCLDSFVCVSYCLFIPATHLLKCSALKDASEESWCDPTAERNQMFFLHDEHLQLTAAVDDSASHLGNKASMPCTGRVSSSCNAAKSLKICSKVALRVQVLASFAESKGLPPCVGCLVWLAETKKRSKKLKDLRT